MRRERVLALVLAVATLAGCGPRLAQPPGGTPEDRIARYRTLMSERQTRAVAMSASASLWVEREGERMPGAQAELRIAAPDRMRLRLFAAFGTAIDLGLYGDSLRAYVPGWKRGLWLDSASDSLGLEAPADRMVRAFSATWQPPEEAWSQAVWRDSLLRVSWKEANDSLSLAIGANGLPALAEVALADGPLLRVRYRAWDYSSGHAWPSHIELEDQEHDVRMSVRATQIRFAQKADEERLAVRWPPGTTTVTLGELRAALGRLGFL